MVDGSAREVELLGNGLRLEAGGGEAGDLFFARGEQRPAFGVDTWRRGRARRRRWCRGGRRRADWRAGGRAPRRTGERGGALMKFSGASGGTAASRRRGGTVEAE